MTSPIQQALSDVRVLDISDGVAGGYCARLLADYGANVLKVEPPFHGDSTRRAGPFPDDIPDPEKSGLHLHVNANKRGITLDITQPAGREILKKLVKDVDILVECFKPGYLTGLGLGHDDLEKVNTALVTLSITPVGQTGPYKDFHATDVGVFAMSGRMYSHGQPDREPLPYTLDVIWYQVAVTAAAAVMGALFAARIQGIGQQVDVSALEALLGNVDNRPLFYEYTGNKTPRSKWPGGIPQGAYPCADGYVVFGVGYDRYFRRLCDAMGHPDIYKDPRFATNAERTRNAEAFEEIFLEWTLQHTKQEIFETCQAHRVMCAPINNWEDLMKDPQLVERGYFAHMEHPKAGKLPVTGAPVKMHGTPWSLRRPAPTLGQHNAEVYAALGYTTDDLAHVRAHGAI
jgi:crotonobetainyl-CoA:carnitine CoA-transferase CaiB-like acyl-CoA transferase